MLKKHSFLNSQRVRIKHFNILINKIFFSNLRHKASWCQILRRVCSDTSFPLVVTFCAMSIYLQNTSEIFYYIEIHTMETRHEQDDWVNVIGCLPLLRQHLWNRVLLIFSVIQSVEEMKYKFWRWKSFNCVTNWRWE